MCRRDFMKTAVLLGAMPSLASVVAVAATQRGNVKTTDIETMILQGPRTYTLVKVLTDSGLYGIGEACGSPGAGVRDGIESIRQAFIGEDPLDVNAWYYALGNRIDGSAHQQLRAVTGVDDVIIHDAPVVKKGHIMLPDKPGLGIEPNPDVVKAHLAKGEVYWS